ncbi:MAG: OmpA family protein, partial [Phenylobacterium sp.]|uniref:OmpA family protein n=1 Tax=Phenylobacterium sp. TaxID=1871053 RepID=UPI00301970F2
PRTASPRRPPPPPPPPAYEAKQFVVYFPFDQSVLTPEAQTIVTEAAEYAKAGNATRVIVVGHTDSSGSPAYNTRLSERRAKAVADALVGQGVGQQLMQVDWKGETQLAVATGDGVKEPLNRRSTIDINF